MYTGMFIIWHYLCKSARITVEILRIFNDAFNQLFLMTTDIVEMMYYGSIVPLSVLFTVTMNYVF